MAIIMSHPMTPQEMRVLQEFRRVKSDTLSIDAVNAIKHPAGGGEGPAVSLVQKGYLSTNGNAAQFTLTQKAKDFLAIDVKPMVEGGGEGEAPAE
ncbi:MAG TPA: hypothetical protein VLU46_13290 [Thermoanaerobaculia bacterium]|nr:hypothetical protein [Thermoanaerobaculia bacterium]